MDSYGSVASNDNFTFTIDKKLPKTPIITPNTTAYTKDGVEMTIVYPSDDVSVPKSNMLYSIVYSDNIGNVTNQVYDDANKPVLTKNGTIKAWSISDVGNQSLIAEKSVTNVDTQIPDINIISNDNKINGILVEKKESSISGIDYEFDTSANGVNISGSERRDSKWRDNN